MRLFFSRIKSFIKGEQNLDKLKKRGLTVGNNLTIMSGVIIDPSHCWHITIGNNVILAPRVHILAHDASTKVYLNVTRVSNTKIGDNVFVGAGTLILPGVTIGNNVVIGAGSVVTKDIPDNSVAVGNPAQIIKSLDSFIVDEKQKLSSDNVFGEQFTLRNRAFGEKEKKVLLEACEIFGSIYVE